LRNVGNKYKLLLFSTDLNISTDSYVRSVHSF